MGQPTDFAGTNKTLTAPDGRDDVAAMRVFSNGNCCVSAWEFSDAEREEIARTGRVFVSVFFGDSQPPIFIGSESSVRGVVQDYGGSWKR